MWRIFAVVVCFFVLIITFAQPHGFDSRPSPFQIRVMESFTTTYDINVMFSLDAALLQSNLHHVNLLQPSILEQDRMGCTPFQYTKPDNDSMSFNGSVVLLIGSMCNHRVQLKHVQELGAIGFLVSSNYDYHEELHGMSLLNTINSKNVATSSNTSTTFHVTIILKSNAHPLKDKGSQFGYVMDGVEGATLQLIRGVTYTFDITGLPTSHLFEISDSPLGLEGKGNILARQATSGGINANIVTYTAGGNIGEPTHFYYLCPYHNYMGGDIFITDAPYEGAHFTIRLVKKINHPWTGQGSSIGFAVNGIEGATLNLTRGRSYTFDVSSIPQVHLFEISASPIGGGLGTIHVRQLHAGGIVTYIAGGKIGETTVLYYQCQFHKYMGGIIYINDDEDGNNNTFHTSSPGWYYHIQYQDAMILSTYLDNDHNHQLTLDINGTTSLDLNERAAFLEQVALFVKNGWTGNCSLSGCVSKDVRSFQDYIERPDLDPCIYRVMTVFCEEGHITAFVWDNNPIITMNMINFTALSIYTHLKVLILNNNPNLEGVIPDTFCNISSISFQYLSISDSGITYLPDCFHNWPHFLELSANNAQLREIPSSIFNNISHLIHLSVNNNSIESFPIQSFQSAILPNLMYLDVGNNRINTTIPTFNNVPNLRSLKMENNLFYFDPATTSRNVNVFDNLLWLNFIRLSNNQLSGSLFTFANCTQLTNVYLNNNDFIGNIPSSWKSLINLKELQLQMNHLNGSILALSGMTQLISIDLSYNQLKTMNALDDVGLYLASSLPFFVFHVNLAHNQFCCYWRNIAPFWPKSNNFLHTLILSHNQLRTFSPNLCNSYLRLIDLSFNNLTGFIDPLCQISNQMMLLDVHGNPNFYGRQIPQTLLFSDSRYESFIVNGMHFLCPIIYSSTETNLIVKFDPFYYNYQGCICENGFYGVPPQCYLIPQHVNVMLPYQEESNNNHIYNNNNKNTSSSVSQYFPLHSSTNVTQLFQLHGKHSFQNVLLTDITYGTNRYMPGMHTYFWLQTDHFVNVSQYSRSTSSSETFQAVQTINNQSYTTPVLTTTLCVFINMDDFSDETDSIIIYDGEHSTDNLVFSVYGGHLSKSNAEGIALSQQMFPPSNTTTTINGITAPYYNHSALFVVHAFSPLITIDYSSHKTNANHFKVETYFSNTCPTTHHWDVLMLRCMVNQPCTKQDYSFVVSKCNEKTYERTVHFVMIGNSSCFPSLSDSFVPDDIQIECLEINLGMQGPVALLSLAVGLCFAGMIPFAFQLYDMFLHYYLGTGTGTGTLQLLHQRNVFIIQKLYGWWSIVYVLGWFLNLIGVVINLGPVTSVQCTLRLMIVFMSFFTTSSSWLMASKRIKALIEQKPLTKKDMLYLSTLLIIMALNAFILLLYISVRSSSLIAYVPVEHTSGLIEHIPTCSLGRVSYWIPVFLLVKNIILVIWSIWSSLPSWNVVLHQDVTKSWKMLFSKDSLLMLTLTSSGVCSTIIYLFIFLFTYTNAIGIVEDNKWIALVQSILYIVHMFVSLVCHFVPLFVRWLCFDRKPYTMKGTK